MELTHINTARADGILARRWVSPTEIRELPLPCPPPTHWVLGNEVTANDTALWLNAMFACYDRPERFQAWLDDSTHFEDGLKKKVTTVNRSAAKRMGLGK